MLQLSDLPLDYKDVVVRVDFNVPINEDGKILDDTRLKASLPTINYLLNRNCRIILVSHLGRPSKQDSLLSLKQLLIPLEKLLKCPVHFIENLKNAKTVINSLSHPSICLLENLRFNSAEEDPSLNPQFAKELASLGDFYVNDAFACAHRAHSSITEIAKYFPKKSAPGFLMTHEIENLSKVLKPCHPFYLLLGGSKISTKIGVINSLLPKCDALFIGGAMAFPFIKALGISAGSVSIDNDQIADAKKILNTAKNQNKTIHLPIDWCCAQDKNSKGEVRIFDIHTGIPQDFQAFDIGPATVAEWSKKLAPAKTIFWNGPLGMYEISPFDQGTTEIAKAIAHINCESIVGGGDSVAAIEKHNLNKGFSHLSTGGGASLEFLEKNSLPGIDALKQ
jgi:phosphoglycerate kinase